MKNLSLFLLLIGSSQAFAVTPDEVIKNMQKAAAITVGEYRKEGISVLVKNSEDCYKDINKYRFYCIYLDLAARHVSERDGAGARFAPENYFLDDAFLPRASEIFVRSNMDMA